ncbi:MAG: hypothetical protein JW856_02135 [Dehalococcoidales bacterium]|nr:hypothetical protein [Dehalococcoidales bacterium]
MKKPELLVLVAIWEFVTAFFAFIGIASIAVFAIPVVLGVWGTWEYYTYGMGYHMGPVGAIFGLSIGILVLLCYLALSIFGGIGLLKGKEWGRIASIVHSALSFFWIPIGTVLGVLAIIYLTKTDVKEYFIPPKA